MAERIYTIKTRLDINNNKELKEYLEKYILEYNSLQRRIFQDIKHNKIDEFTGLSKYVTYICKKYNVLKRTANSIIKDMNGSFKALKELKQTELTELHNNIDSLEDKIKNSTKTLNELKPLVTINKATEDELKRYNYLRKNLYFLKNKLNKKKQQATNLENNIKNNKYSLGFGTKKMFKKQFYLKDTTHLKWYNAYVKSRDKGIYYLGSGDESYGNEMLQLIYDKEKDCFNVILRKEYNYRKSNKVIDRDILIHDINFKYMQKELINAINSKQPITYRVTRNKNKWYLVTTFSMDVPCRTVSNYGVIGLDYNNGFIELAETNEIGNLVYLEHFDLEYHGTGNKSKTEIEKIIKSIVLQANEKGKSIVIENLNFKNTKAKTNKAKSKKGKEYNKMIHTFDYSRYKSTFENCCKKNGVELILVNPAYTSKIGDKKYKDLKKLTIHQAAAYVIGRRGQGYKDKLK